MAEVKARTVARWEVWIW